MFVGQYHHPRVVATMRRGRGQPPGGFVLEIHVEDTGDYTLCRPIGELDAYTVGQFRESLVELSSKPRLLIDLSEVPFMDSAGLGALIGGIRRAREAQGDVSVACSRPTLTRLLHTTGFDRIVPVTETVDAAVQALLDPPDLQID
jgi:anti-sigma B factor antagonist